MKPILPISTKEFLETFIPCIPRAPFSWKGPLVVATSGGPDSTCLLFLLKRMLSEPPGRTHAQLPPSITAVNIDHGLQAASREMSRNCIEISERIGVPATTVAIPWGTPTYPQMPEPGTKFENIARLARYRAFWGAMQVHGSRTIALGHHADDQLETALMRIGRGTGEVGIAGMRACRLWGSGYGRDAETYYGPEGMKTWVLRPMLRFSKARILATCEEHELNYITDHTNFQPDLTYRNAIRHWLATRGPENDGMDSFSSGTRQFIQKMIARNNEKGWLDLSKGPYELYAALQRIGEDKAQIEEEASEVLQACRRAAPPSTLLLHGSALARVFDPLVQREVVRRVLRYVSPATFGSLLAQAGNRSESLLIAQRRLFLSEGGAAAVELTPFDCGGYVTWRPVAMQPDGSFRWRPPRNEDEELGWLVHRARPRRYVPSPLERDVTSLVYDASHSKTASLSVFYDERFELILDVPTITKAVDGDLTAWTFFLEPDEHFSLPRLFARRGKSELVEFIVQIERDAAEEMFQVESLLSRLRSSLDRRAPPPLVLDWEPKRASLPTSRFAQGLIDISSGEASFARKRGCVFSRFVRVLDVA